MFDVVERAIRCFENWSGTTVMIFDFSADFSPLLPADKKFHNYKCCEAAKIFDNAKRCIQFDFWTMQQEAWRYRDGFLKLCHCGLLEWVIPLYSQDKLLCLLEAGIRKPAPGVEYTLPILKESPSGYIRQFPDVRELTNEEAEQVMEGLRQLATRLLFWHRTLHEELDNMENAPRHVLLHRIMKSAKGKKMNLKTLASMMHLSPSRAAHVIKEITGKSFKQVQNEYRLKHVCLQLHTTSLSVEKIASDGGFTDIAHFYRTFRKYTRMTPRQYRNSMRKTPSS